MRYTLSDPELPPYSREYRDLVGGGSGLLPDGRDDRIVGRRRTALAGRAVSSDLVEELADWNRRLGAGPGTESSLEQLAAGAPVVIGGQQPAPAGGPLYSLYKAITVVEAARHLSARGHGPVVPIFWVHSDDHDLDEVRSVTVLDEQLQPLRLDLNVNDGLRGTPVGSIPIATSEGLLELLGRCGNADVMDLLSPGPAVDLGEWQAHVLLKLLSDRGLVMFDPRLSTSRLEAAELLARCAEQRDLAEAVAGQAARLSATGIETTLDLEPGHTCLFYLGSEGREALFWDGDTAIARSGSVSFGGRELNRAIGEEPDRFSPGVALRPFVQDLLFPVLVSVCGPGEAGYLPAARGLEEKLGRTLAPVHPRLSLVVADSAEAEWCERHGLTPLDLADQKAVEARLFDSRGGDRIDQWFERLLMRIEAAYDEITPELVRLDSDLEAIAAGNRERVAAQVQYLWDKARQKHRRTLKPLRRELGVISNRLWPEGQTQERAFGAAWPLLKYGGGWFNAVLSVPIDGQFRVMVVGEG